MSIARGNWFAYAPSKSRPEIELLPKAQSSGTARKGLHGTSLGPPRPSERYSEVEVGRRRRDETPRSLPLAHLVPFLMPVSTFIPDQPVSGSLASYYRAFKPDHEAAPRPPVAAVALTAAGGVPFVLVREEAARDAFGQMLAWFLWRGNACVGFLSGNIAPGLGSPFVSGRAYAARAEFRLGRQVNVVRCYVTDGAGKGMGEGFAPIASRGLGLMTAAYLQIIRELSGCGWALASNPAARISEASRRLWQRIAATPGVEVVEKRRPVRRDYAFMLADALGDNRQ